MCKRILAVDDDPAILSVLTDLLEYAGYEVNTLSRGDFVYEEIRKFTPDLILLDVMIANLDGREICRMLKNSSETYMIPVILISATHNLKDTLRQQGAPDDFLSKPFDIYILLEKIERQLAA